VISMLENGLSRAIAEAGPLPAPSRGRVSRRVKSFPIAPRVTLTARTKKASAGCSTFRPATGWACSTAWHACWPRHHMNLQLAKVATLGERVDDTFLIDGPELQHNKKQIADRNRAAGRGFKYK
jgi:[protein-PII] uridylyltransferase